MIRFLTGDCLKEMRKMPAASVDLVLTDPPEPEKDAPREFIQAALTECLRVSRGAVVWLGVPIEDGRFEHGPFDPAPDYKMQWIVVDGMEPPAVIGKVPIYAWRGPAANIGTALIVHVDWALTKIHPGGKPTLLMEAILDEFPGARVLDPFCGIGSVALACKEMGRSFTGIDINAEYVRIAAGRVHPAKEAA